MTIQQTERAREIAERIVAANIDAWGWGPLSDIEGLSEHELAVKAAEAGYLEARAAIAALRSRAHSKEE